MGPQGLLLLLTLNTGNSERVLQVEEALALIDTSFQALVLVLAAVP